MKSYEQFWAELAPAYPVSKGAMRLPIATTLQTIPELDMEVVLGELQGILQQLLDDPDVQAGAQLRAKEAGEEFLTPLIDANYSGVVRFDCVVADNGAVKILELNADYPDGLLLHDYTYSALAGTACTLHRDAYVRYFAAADRVHISHPAEAGFLDAYYVEKEALEAAGHAVSIGAVPTDEATVWHRRCAEVGKMQSAELAHWGRMEAQHLNSFALRTLGYKALLSTLTHPYVPQTLSLDTKAAREMVAADPARFVLKPSNGCEGYGLHFGHTYTQAAWRRHVEALPLGYIAQEFVSLPKRQVDVYADGAVQTDAYYYDFCPHFFIRDGKVTDVGHILMRFSQSPVVNVTQGGAIGYHRLPSVRGFAIV